MSVRGTFTRILCALLRSSFASYVEKTGEKPHLEVERKFKLSAQESQELPEKLRSFGFSSAGTADMIDYFLPCLIPGDMLRVRREVIDGGHPHFWLTFKRWVETEDGVKERQESERQVKATAAAFWLFVGRYISGGALLSFSKQRVLMRGTLDGRDAIVSLDDVKGLGHNSGNYMEVEVVVPVGTDVTSVRGGIVEFANALLSEQRPFEQRSYRDMLIEATLA